MVHHVITWVSRISNEVKSLVLLFLLGLVLLECLGMCSSVPVHIHSHRSKARLVIENWWSGQRTMFIVGPVHTRDNGLRSIWVWSPELASKLKGLICMPLKQEWNQDRGASTPQPVPCGLRWVRNMSCANRYKHVHILKAISFLRPGVSYTVIKYIQDYF